MYTRQAAVELCVALEHQFSLIGFHVALGGSCLYRGESTKDVDVIVYPHNDPTSGTTNEAIRQTVISTLTEKMGFALRSDRKSHLYPQSVVCTEHRRTGQRVDFFIMNRI